MELGAFRRVVEYAYTGSCHVPPQHVSTTLRLARRCQLASLVALLTRRRPSSRDPIPSFHIPLPSPSLTAAVDPLADVVVVPASSPPARSPSSPHSAHSPRGSPAYALECSTSASTVSSAHPTGLHAHRVVLAGRCEYFRALFAFCDSCTLEMPELNRSEAACFLQW